MKRTTSPDRSSSRRGIAAVATVVTIPVALGFAALSIDVGHIYNVRNELQNAADAGALAGASGLGGENLDEAFSRALDIVEKHAEFPDYSTKLTPLIELGTWDHASRAFIARFSSAWSSSAASI